MLRKLSNQRHTPAVFSLWLSFNNENMNKCQCILEHGVESNRVYYFRQNLNDGN